MLLLPGSVDGHYGVRLLRPYGAQECSTYVATALPGILDTIRFPISDFRHF
jgi:hypothetical protein